MNRPTATLAAGARALLDAVPVPNGDPQDRLVTIAEAAWWNGAIYVVSTLLEKLCDGDFPGDRPTAVSRQVAAWSLEISERIDARNRREGQT